MTAGRPTVYDSSFPERAIKLGREGKTIAQIAADLGISKSTLYLLAQERDEFSDAISQAVEAAEAYWDDIGNKAVVGGISGFNHQTYQLIMRNRFRQSYGEISTTHVNVTGLPNIHQITRTVIDPSKLELDELQQLADMYARQSQVKSPLTIDHRHEPEDDEDD
ncbi:helix-turn-helix domain-containing protein [Rhizobium panacihumi]|uniref:helix-turn-helix domain-containing protein n=1 Tax=Rhizobium panacihumi TaxID=2008450 RepID=UPI003D7A5498